MQMNYSNTWGTNDIHRIVTPVPTARARGAATITSVQVIKTGRGEEGAKEK